MGTLDWCVLAAYALGLLAVGAFYHRRTQTTEDFYLGGRVMRSWMVGLSLFATLLSTASYMAWPGEIIRHGPMIAAGLLSAPIVVFIVGWFMIPAFMKLHVTSANEILEAKLGLSIRILGSFFFLSLRIFWMATIIFITANAVILPIAGLDPAYLPAVSMLLGAITVIYTSAGGLRAVILTDVIQTFILFLGAILTIALITLKLNGIGWFPTEWADNWDPPRIWFDTSARVTFAGAIMMHLFWYICTAGSDQMAVQRYLATRDLRAARNAFTLSVFTGVLVRMLMLLLGFALLGYLRAYPEALGVGMNIEENADQVFSRFIVSGLPPGVTGLITAALLAAAMSSLSSGLNSATAIISIDIFDRFGSEPADEQTRVRRGRLISYSVGFFVVILSLAVGNVQGNFVEIVNKICNLFVAPLFFLFLMAMYMPWANVPGTWAGAVASIATAIGIALFEVFGLSFIWIMPCSLTCGVVTALAVSPLFARKGTCD